jgi:hypothetical protein
VKEMKAFARPEGFAGVISAAAAKVASTREDVDPLVQ